MIIADNIDPVTRTYRYDKQLIDNLTGLRSSDRGSIIGWLSRQGEAVQVEVFRRQAELLRGFQKEERAERLLQSGGQIEEVNFAYLVLAVVKMRAEEKAVKRKARSASPDKLMVKRVARIKSKKPKRTAPQLTRLREQYFLEVDQLRCVMTLSWREISAYLLEHHGVKWSHGWVRNNYERVKKERTLAGMPVQAPVLGP